MKNEKSLNNTKKDYKVLFPVLVALCLIPFIVLTKDYQTEFTKFNWFNNKEIDQIDSFEYAKSRFVMIMGAIAAVVIAINEYSKSKKKKQLFGNCDIKVMVLCAVFAVMVVVSSLFSKYSHLAFTGGGYGQWQTMWVLLSFVALFMYAYIFVDSEKQISLMAKCLMVSTAFVTVIGILQSVGHNPLRWGWVQKIITSRSAVDGVTFSDGVSNVILTFSNPNYVGPYVALIFPFVVAFAATRISENKGKRIVCCVAAIVVAIGLLCTLFGSSSSAGAIAVAAGVVAAAVMLLSGIVFKEKRENKSGQADGADKGGRKKMQRYIIAIAVVLVIVVVGVGVSRTSFFKNTVNKLLQGGNDTRNVASIVNTDAGLEVVMRSDEEFKLIPSFIEGDTLAFGARDARDSEITIKKGENNKYYYLDDDRFRMLTIEVANFQVEENQYRGFRLNDAPNEISWSFMYVDNEWQYFSPFGKLLKLREIEHFGFKDYQNIANRRGFIWSRSIPLLKKYWFNGIGPNAFIIAFPNDDFVGSKRVGGSTTLVDKPHNAFLQIYIQTGGISALAYCGLWILYMIQGVKLFWRRRKYTDTEKIGLGLLVGIFSFAVAGITNDTVVGSQTIYWILLGAGYAVNRVIVAGRTAVTESVKKEKNGKDEAAQSRPKKGRKG